MKSLINPWKHDHEPSPNAGEGFALFKGWKRTQIVPTAEEQLDNDEWVASANALSHTEGDPSPAAQFFLIRFAGIAREKRSE